uniref:Uncharacterized protein n=1 Tax=Human herpesvirus 2 TaxID=10310 RepID=A0A481TPF3_HHV2|nr:hypothetical protein [Human alphaherpesvirus 2]
MTLSAPSRPTTTSCRWAVMRGRRVACRRITASTGCPKRS